MSVLPKVSLLTKSLMPLWRHHPRGLTLLSPMSLTSKYHELISLGFKYESWGKAKPSKVSLRKVSALLSEITPHLKNRSWGPAWWHSG